MTFKVLALVGEQFWHVIEFRSVKKLCSQQRWHFLHHFVTNLFR